jgi:uncharacterized membrane protein YbaN (DUF454 family)
VFKKYLLIVAGFISIGIGILGIFLPLLPTTAFMLLAAWLFSKSSPKWRQWLINHRLLGKHIRNYTIHKGITSRARKRSLATLWLTLVFSAWLTNGTWWILAILAIVGIGVSWHLIALKTITEHYSKVNPDDYINHDDHQSNVA